MSSQNLALQAELAESHRHLSYLENAVTALSESQRGIQGNFLTQIQAETHNILKATATGRFIYRDRIRCCC